MQYFGIQVSATALVAKGVAEDILSPGSESWVRVLNPGWVFEKVSFGGGQGVPLDLAYLKPTRNRFFELLAASKSFWSRLGAAGINLGCQGMVLAAWSSLQDA